MTGTVEFIQKIRYVEIACDNGETQVYAIPETCENVQELVRCKDCKYWYNGCCYSRVSNRINFTVEVPDDWFCADGERRTDDA